MPYRDNADLLTPHSLAELFAEARDLETDDGLALRHQATPWHRINAAVLYTPPSLGRLLQELAALRSWQVIVERDASVKPGRYRLIHSYAGVYLHGESDSRSVTDLERLDSAWLRSGTMKIAISGDTLEFRVTSYEQSELARLFAQSYPWDELRLPPLLERSWRRLPRRR